MKRTQPKAKDGSQPRKSEKWPIEKWSLESLKEHPRQAELFGDMPDEELHQLAAHMEVNDLEKPLHIRPDGVVIAGHQRLRAAKYLGWAEIDVIVRSDLDEAGDSAVEKHLIEDNLIRRQLTPLGRARCIKALFEIEEGGSLDWNFMARAQRKETIGRRLGMSPRNVNRYLAVLTAPKEIQDAFDRGEIKLVDAGMVGSLPESVQQQIVARIRDGESARDVVSDHSPARKSSDSVDASFKRLLRALKREVALLQGKVAQIDLHDAARNRKLLGDAAAFLAQIVEILPAKPRSNGRQLAKLGALMRTLKEAR